MRTWKLLQRAAPGTWARDHFYKEQRPAHQHMTTSARGSTLQLRTWSPLPGAAPFISAHDHFCQGQDPTGLHIRIWSLSPGAALGYDQYRQRQQTAHKHMRWHDHFYKEQHTEHHHMTTYTWGCHWHMICQSTWAHDEFCQGQHPPMGTWPLPTGTVPCKLAHDQMRQRWTLHIRTWSLTPGAAPGISAHDYFRKRQHPADQRIITSARGSNLHITNWSLIR